jgi:hypothetical protein
MAVSATIIAAGMMQNKHEWKGLLTRGEGGVVDLPIKTYAITRKHNFLSVGDCDTLVYLVDSHILILHLAYRKRVFAILVTT